jgi:hypothetical protein
MIVIEIPINYLVDYLIWHGKQFSTKTCSILPLQKLEMIKLSIHLSLYLEP